MSKASFRMQEAQKHFREKYYEHVHKCNKWMAIHGLSDGYAHWTFGYSDDWDMIRKITLHMFNRSTVEQLTDAEAILANQIAMNITDVIFAQLDIIGHSRDEIEKVLQEDKNEKGIN